jgi:multimeric flavodoxin WrbA
MRILAVLGSPRSTGHTSVVLERFLVGVADGASGVQVTKVFLHEKRIDPCTGCDVCQKTPEPRCVISDDMTALYPLITQADGLVIATPVYWWAASAQTKLFIDRSYATMYGEQSVVLQGKQLAVLTTYGGEDPNTGPGLIKGSFEGMADFSGMVFSIFYAVCTGTLAAHDNTVALAELYQLGRKFASYGLHKGQ